MTSWPGRSTISRTSLPGAPAAQPRAGAAAPDDYDYPLPEGLIAQRPRARRGQSRLMRVGPGEIRHCRIGDLPGLMGSGDLLVLNDTRVRKARLRGRKATGGRIEVLVERISPDGRQATALTGSNRPAGVGTLVDVGGARLRVTGRDGDLCRLEVLDGPRLETLLDAAGETPLPPYITRETDADDEVRYQTVFARADGSCAAPTAGLHFTRRLLDRLRRAGVEVVTLTLHVGFGTFQPLRADGAGLHPELFDIPAETVEAVRRARRERRPVTACGTTALRALETCAMGGGRVRTGETSLFVRPGFPFRWVDRLLTNFHLPRTSLFMLACAFGGEARVREAYREAVRRRYRFYSYGDAMLLARQ